MAFSVIGRVQYQHASGIWNEWHVLFENGSTGWLSEASGSYVLSFLSASAPPKLPLEQYKLDLSLPLTSGKRLTVTAIETARCIAGQGELPFKVNTGFDVTVVDLSNEILFASLDFSETPPLLFLGEQVELSALYLSNLRDIRFNEIKTKARSFNCPQCAAPVNAQLSSTQTITCKSCTAILDVRNKTVETLVKSQKARGKLSQPLIPLGSVGRFEGVDYTAIGYVKRNDGLYGWSEYLLHHPAYGFRWLICSQRHWTFARPLQKSLNTVYGGGVNFESRHYKHFANYEAKVIEVIGEFYWQIKLGESVIIDDYICPPYSLSKERDHKEVTWTAGEYFTPQEIESAFGGSTFALPEPSGVAPNQPSPYAGAVGRAWATAFFSFISLALLAQLFFVFFSSNRVLLNTETRFQKTQVDPLATYQAQADSTEFQSPVFKVTGRASNLIIQQNANNLNNSWLATDLALIEQNTGKVYEAQREASYYSGVEGGEYWREDNSQQEVIFSQIPAGNYYLKISAESDWSSSSLPPVDTQIKVLRDVPQWSNFWFLVLFLALGPAVLLYRSHRFEIHRWAESDHPISGVSE